LKIIKHCQESLPQLVTGSLLGLTVSGGILEITHAFPFPDSAPKDAPDKENMDTQNLDETAVLEGHEYQLEMMKMLREVNVDNNCVGWYQSTYLGSYSTASLLENQLSYQTELSPNAVVLLYDPTQSAHGSISLKCFRLSPEAIAFKMENKNVFIDPKKIFQEIPIHFKNLGLARALIYNMAQGCYPHSTLTNTASASSSSSMTPGMTITATNILPTAPTGFGGTRATHGSATSSAARPLTSTLDEYYYDALFSPFSSTALLLKYPPLFSNSSQGNSLLSSVPDSTFDQLDLSTNPYLEKHLEFLCSWVDDLATEQNKFQMFARSLARGTSGITLLDSTHTSSASNVRGHHGRMDKRRKETSHLNSEMNLQEAWGAQDAPKRLESLLIANQIRNYCDQMDKYAGTGFGKLFLAGGLQKEERSSL
jgi:hypothetical protein